METLFCEKRSTERTVSEGSVQGLKSLCVKTIAVEVESKPAPFEKRKGCGTQSLHPTDVSVSEKK
jgi:hypothetical protein